MNILDSNPMSDEAIFASLAIISKSSRNEEFLQNRPAFFFKINGTEFVNRLLEEDEHRLLGMNFLTVFCDDVKCKEELMKNSSNSILNAMEKISVTSCNDQKAVLDLINCSVGLQNLTGTIRILLRLLEKCQSDELKTEVAKAIGSTTDKFFANSEEQALINSIKQIPPVPYIRYLIVGLNNRWRLLLNDDSLEQFKSNSGFLKEVFQIMVTLLKSKDIEPTLRRGCISLCTTCLELNAELCLANNVKDGLLTLSAVCCIEMRVGLARLSSALDPHSSDKQWNHDEYETLCNVAKCLDRIASWMCFLSIRDDFILDEKTLQNVIVSLTSSTQTMNSFFLDTAVIANSEKVKPLTTLLVVAVCSCLQLFWMDDPIVGRGLQEIAERSSFTKACGTMLCECDPSVLNVICPVLAHLPVEMFESSVRTKHCMPIRRLIDCEWKPSLDHTPMSPSRVFFSAMVIIAVLRELNHPEALDTMRTSLQQGLRKFSTLSSTNTKIQGMDDLSFKCILGTMLVLDEFIAPETKATRVQAAKKFLSDSDEYLKHHAQTEGEDYGAVDYVELGSKLNWKELRTICEIVRLECL